MTSTGNFLRKYWRRVAVVAGVIMLLLAIYALQTVVLPFGIALALAYILLPLVSWVEARFPHNWRGFSGRRISAIAIVYLMVVLVVGVFSFFVVSAVVDAIHSLAHNSVAYFSSASATLKEWTEFLRQMVPSGMRDQADTFIQEMGTTLLDSVHKSIMNGIAELPTRLGFIGGLAAVPFILYYILKDQKKVSVLYSSLPAWSRPHARSIFLIAEKSFGRYIRATLTLGLIVGTMTLVGLLIIRAPLAPLLAVLLGVTEMIPMVGPWIGGIVAVMVTLSLAPDKAIWVGVICLSVQLLENILLSPRIQSAFFRIHPVVTIALLMAGAYFAGVWGMMLVMPLAATVVGIYKYCCELAPGENGSEKEKSDPGEPPG